MPFNALSVQIDDCFKAVGYVLDIPPGDLCGYVVIGVRPDGSKDMTANLAQPIEMIGVIAEVIADLVVDIKRQEAVKAPG